MFLFNDPAKTTDIELVKDKALPTASSVGVPLATTFVLGLGGFIVSANPIVGGALAAVPAYAMFKRLKKSWKDNVFERRNPEHVAHLIKTDSDMCTWIEHHGVDEVRSQLLTALKHRQKFTSCAKRTLKAICPESDLPPMKVEDFLSAQAALPPGKPDSGWQHLSDLEIGANTRLNSIDVPSVAVDSPFQIPVESPESKLFDWNKLNTLYDDFPHLMLLGKTGAGKSFLAERMGRFLDGATVVITPKKKPKDFEGMQVIGIPYNYREIAANLAGLAELVKNREAEMNATGKENFQPVNVVLDEVPTFVSGCKDLDLDVVKDLKFIIRAGRTSKVRLILLAQGQEVKTLGIEGEGGLRYSLSYVYLKGFAEKHAQENKLDISQYDRPCIIDGQVADISQLIQLAEQKTKPSTQVVEPQSQAVEPPIASTPDQLQRMYEMPTADHEVEEGAIETNSSIDEIKVAFPNWNEMPKHLEIAAFVVDWLRQKPSENFTAAKIRNVKRLREDPKVTNENLTKLLDALAAKGFVTKSDDKYSAQLVTDDYDF